MACTVAIIVTKVG